MPDRPTDRAVAEAAPLDQARRAAGARGAGSQDPLVSVELGPRLDAVAAGIDLIRRELRV
jgi:hypothetical protein